MKGKSREEESREARVLKIAFWNVAGLGNKDKDFWDNLKEWDVMFLSETWADTRGWEKIRDRVPKGYEWGVQKASRKNRKGRAMGGMVVGIRKELSDRGSKIVELGEGLLSVGIKIGKESWRIVGVYIKEEGREGAMQLLRQMMESKDGEAKVIIGGDFNARTGREGGGWGENSDGKDGEEQTRRMSKDSKVDKEGRKLIELIGECGWEMLNGRMVGDEEGEYTYVGARGSTVIDYILVDREAKDRIEKMRVIDKVESDHFPVVAEVRSEGREVNVRRRGREIRGVWDEEGRELFRRVLEGEIEEKYEQEVNEEWDRMRSKIKDAMGKTERERRKGKKVERGWWDEECEGVKRQVRRELRRWRKGLEDRSKYIGLKREYKVLCERKKEEENRKWEKKAEEARNESEVWEIVNKDRRKKRRVNEGIRMEEWKEYFMCLLGGVETRVVRGDERKDRESGRREVEQGISKEEVRKVVSKLKVGKAGGLDGIPNEVWRWGGRRLEEWIGGFLNRVWRGEEWPENWKEGVVVPIVKKGEGKQVKEYRGITLMPTLYKVYAKILAERLKEEIEEKGIIPENQAGFRNKRGTIDNIFVLNYVVNRSVDKKGGKLVALFVDLKAAFDSVDRGILIKTMRERGIREGLIERVEGLLRETKSRVRVGEETEEEFWTGRGVRQGCPLSPLLFNLLISDLEEVMGRVKWGGVKVGGVKVCTLAYADDLVLIAEDEDQMRSMLERLERYLDEKNLVLNAEKSKIVRFRKGGGRESRRSWWWKGNRIEEVKEFCYLGYVFQKNGGQEAQIKDRVRRAAAVMGQVWGIGKRRYGGDWGRRVWLFDRLVWTVMGYGVEIWGWKERDGLEKLEERYLRWMLGLDGHTPGYMVREEIQRDKLRGKAGRRAWKYERRLEEGGGSELARMCLEEIKERCRTKKVGSGWEGERRSFWEDRGGSLEELGEEREEDRVEAIFSKERKMQREERWERIVGSDYNRWYKMVKEEGVPGYLKKGWGESRWRRIIRCRLGNEMRGNKYWEEEEKKRCRLCGGGVETWEHVWEECRDWGLGRDSWQEVVGRILGADGEGESWFRDLMREREGIERGEDSMKSGKIDN